MAVMLSAKPADATQLYSWQPALTEGDGIASYRLDAATITILASQQVGDAIQMFISGGTAGNVYPVAATVETSLGETLEETLYLPVSGPGNGFTDTAQDVVDYALRPIVGIGMTPTDDERDGALELLNGMLGQWAATGADIGAPLPLALDDTLYAADSWVLAIKSNLRVIVSVEYGLPPDQITYGIARSGLKTIKNARRPREPQKLVFQ